MEDMIANIETDIVAGSYEIFNKVSIFIIIKERPYNTKTWAEFIDQ